jgi:hypothetical protein
MRKISSYLYPNRIELLADLAGFSTEYTNVYQRNVKIYKGVDNIIEFDVKNADQKRIDLVATVDPAYTPPITDLKFNVMDAMGNFVGQYNIDTDTGVKGIATVTIPSADLDSLDSQFLKYSVTATKDTATVPLYADSRFGAVGVIELDGSAVPVTRPSRDYTSFTAEIDLKGVPTWHSSAIPATFYEAVKTETLDFDIKLRNLVGSIWIEGTKNSTINVEAFKGADYIWSATYTPTAPGDGDLSTVTANIGDYKYFRVSFTTPTMNGVGSSFLVERNNGAYDVSIRAGGTGYAVGSQMKVLGSLLGGVDGVNDLIISVTQIDAATSVAVSSYTISTITGISWTGTATSGTGTNIVTGTNITGMVDKVTVS